MNASQLRHRVGFAMTLAALCSASCSSSEEGPGRKINAALEDGSGFCEYWAESVCNETVVRRCAAAAPEECIDAQRAFCSRLVPEEGYSPNGAFECLDAVASAFDDGELDQAERDLTQSLAGACNRLLSGALGSGGVCSASSDCSTEKDLSCVVRSGDALGTCQVADLVEGGFECSEPDQVCSDGFYCDGRHCLAKGAAGEICTPEIPCGEGLLCVAKGMAGVCRPKASTGEFCDEDAECLSDICAKLSPTSGVCAETIVLSASEPLCKHMR